MKTSPKISFQKIPKSLASEQVEFFCVEEAASNAHYLHFHIYSLYSDDFSCQ